MASQSCAMSAASRSMALWVRFGSGFVAGAYFDGLDKHGGEIEWRSPELERAHHAEGLRLARRVIGVIATVHSARQLAFGPEWLKRSCPGGRIVAVRDGHNGLPERQHVQPTALQRR